MDRPMNSKEPLIRNVSDTARWVAFYRARETERSDALFRDSLARRLAGPRGEEISIAMSWSRHDLWPWTMRTVLIDQFITDQVAQGVDTVINLAAGFDARPYRMNVPVSLNWIEIDLPELIDEKEKILADEKPRVRLERIRLDLADSAARRDIFEKLGPRTKKALIITEGLLVYLTREQVAELANDLARPPSFRRWAIDISSPALLRLLAKSFARHLGEANAPFKFGPPEGVEFFAPAGWKPLQIHTMLHAAARLKRLPLFLRIMATLMPEKKTPPGNRRLWGACCLLGRGD